ncbi:MAG: hypothetical protein K9H84_08175, partial [Bacteroidales bacterium]|nr:hypothetical protein [Bacteroidales bacterium]
MLKYEFTDVEAPEETLYYRLKQIDYDGQYEYSKIIVVQTDNSMINNKLNIYPNPVKGRFKLQLPEYTGKMQVDV